MTTVTFRVDDALGAMLQSAAQEAGTSVSAYVKDGIKTFLALAKQKRRVPSFMRFAGCLSHDTAKEMLTFNRTASFSQIEPKMWQ